MDLIKKISEKLQDDQLPGEIAQIRMAHAFRRKLWPAPESAIPAGVLIFIYPKNNEWHLVFIERTSRNPADVHGGQISFPGGKMDPCDENLISCAIREAEEEVGILKDSIQILGQLTPLYIPVSNFLVYPVVGFSEVTPLFSRQEKEVNAVIEMPFHHFTNGHNIKHMDMMFGSGMKMEDVPYFDAHGKVIWGATAMILSELLVLLEESQS